MAGSSFALGRADALQLPFSNGVFDVVLNWYLLDLLGELEIARVLRLGGRALTVTMTEPVFGKWQLWYWAYLWVPSCC